MAEEHPFKIGDVVVCDLADTAVKMVVRIPKHLTVNSEGKDVYLVICEWFDKHDTHHAISFRPEQLKKYVPRRRLPLAPFEIWGGLPS